MIQSLADNEPYEIKRSGKTVSVPLGKTGTLAMRLDADVVDDPTVGDIAKALGWADPEEQET